MLLFLLLINLTICKRSLCEPIVCVDLDNMCQSNLCFDALSTNENTECADKTICESRGCSVIQDKFVCCCSQSMCNGKSEKSVKSRLWLWKWENPGEINIDGDENGQLVKTEHILPNPNVLDNAKEHIQSVDTYNEENGKPQNTAERLVKHDTVLKKVIKYREDLHSGINGERENKTNIDSSDDDSGKSETSSKTGNKYQDDNEKRREFHGNISQDIHEVPEKRLSIFVERKISMLRVARGGITVQPRDSNVYEESQKTIWKSGIIPWWIVVISGLLVATVVGGMVYRVIKKRRSRGENLSSITA